LVIARTIPEIEKVLEELRKLIQYYQARWDNINGPIPHIF
jgi:hypothetical protein